MDKDLAKKLGQSLLVGFQGTSLDDPWTKRLIQQISAGNVGGVILFRHNIQGPEQVKTLNAALKSAAKGIPLLVSLDQEGGQVQRLSSQNGFDDHKSAKEVARSMTAEQAEEHYASMARMISSAGFNLTFGPDVDLDIPPGSPVIGGKERSYGEDPSKVEAYGGAFVDGMRRHGVLSCLKHFPGHGSARGDTHAGLVDVTQTWEERELEPFYRLIRKGRADMVMTAHIFNKRVDDRYVATLSEAVLGGRLREDAPFDGVIITDDMHMGAIQLNYGLEEAVVQTLRAGADMLCLSNNPAAAKGVPAFKPDPALPETVVDMLVSAVKDGRLSEERVEASYRRILKLKGLG
jgi:beta-N-acetylhexosaminidase